MKLIPSHSANKRRVKMSTIVRLAIPLGILISIWHLSQFHYEIRNNEEQFLSKQWSRSPAHDIIIEAYQQTYSILVDTCPPSMMLKECMRRLFTSHYEILDSGDYSLPKTNHRQLKRIELKSNNNQQRSILQIRKNPPPWWFFTMLRDGSSSRGTLKRDNITYVQSGLFGIWHEAAAENPNVAMCMIEKVANTQWRKVFFRMNGAYAPNATKKMPFTPQRYNRTTRIRVPMPQQTYPSFVFLRDPLERFLSAYLDKCYLSMHRRIDHHCEPNILFNNPSTKVTLMEGLFNNTNGAILQKKEAFEMYVDTIPLRWNMHFFPQSLYCDGLYRTIDNYDFVGYMGPHFYKDLDEIAHRYGGRFAQEVHKVFDLDKHIAADTINKGVETSAPTQVKDFYSPRSLRRVLEYVSIDYVFLEMPVPQWAHEMLLEER